MPNVWTTKWQKEKWQNGEMTKWQEFERKNAKRLNDKMASALSMTNAEQLENRDMNTLSVMPTQVEQK
jgi:hypothetical protein